MLKIGAVKISQNISPEGQKKNPSLIENDPIKAVIIRVESIKTIINCLVSLGRLKM